MTDKDNITLPREVVEKVETLMKIANRWEDDVDILVSTIVDLRDDLREALAAPKQDLMTWAKDAGSSPEDLERFATYTIATKDFEIATLQEENEALRRDAELGRWLRDWLDSNGLLVRAIRGESLAGYEHPEVKALWQDAERYRWLRENAAGFSGEPLDAAVDAAMKEDKT